ncbi:hypothetical protein [Aeromicrobium sp.]|uniref:hypothetical protein n=1 Tax=Aeromicrobium sp. TaxID=1871063 RepID=UPI0019B02E44|nr:hypothetical protein [Aeromicrobium sp.]MBC7630100.1 SseB family protein [Aeromicrobium sp.]
MRFLDAEVVVPSGKPIGGEPFSPVLIDHGVDRYLAVFTTLRGAGTVAHIAPFTISLTGRDVIAGLDDDVGVVVNPGGNGFHIDPRLAATIRANLDPPRAD